MPPVPSHPVLSCAEAKAWESALLKDEAAEWTAMQAAGGKTALSLLEDFREIGGLPASARLLVLAGKGHNGGDALLAAKFILEQHPQAVAEVLLCFGEAVLRPLARRALDELRRSAGTRVRERSVEQLKAEFASYDLCLDGVFGFQFRPPLDEATAGTLAWVNTHPRIRLRAAVDLPSGLGEPNAGTVFRADFTYATGIVKAPVLLPVNAGFVGRLRYLDLGFFKTAHPEDSPYPVGRVVPDEPVSSARVLITEVLAALTHLRPAQTDKRTYGHLAVVGGSHSYPGAVVLAVRAALRSGAGLVTAFVPERFAPEYAARYSEAMWVGCPETKSGGLAPGALELIRTRGSRATAMLVGPGLAADPDTIALLTKIVGEAAIPLVLDADALRPEVIEVARTKPFIGTPHAGELQRIEPALYPGGKLTAPQAVLVLKGPLTRVSDGTTTFFSPFGGPVLARGGSGDVLAGLIGGLLAQQPADTLLAACRGVVWHGRAADLLARTHGQVAVETSQLLEQLGPALTLTA